jgi:hypothetical protein
VPVAHELMLFGKSFDWLSFPHGFIAINVVNGLTLKDIEAAIDPTFFAMRLFLKVDDVILIEHKPPKPRRGQYRSHSGQFSVRPMKLDGGLNVDI